MGTRKLLSVALAAIAVGAAAPLGAAGAHGAKPLAAVTGTAVDITTTSAVLAGTVTAAEARTSYAFEYGTTTGYGSSTPVVALDERAGDDPVGVSATIDGLQPSTAYHFRLVVAGRHRHATGVDATFTTAAPPAVAPGPIPPAAGIAPASPLVSLPEAPALGRQIVVTPVAGTVTVRSSAGAAPVALGVASTLPVGTLVDTRHGTARLITAIDRAGRRQSVLLREGLVEIRQAARAGGLTDLRLRGANFATCGRGVRARAAAVVRRRRRPRRTLWARDTGGHFRTRGSNSVATVRGTTWRTTDTCAGTTTSVIAGSVIVRDLRSGRRVVVRAGGRYLARSRR